MKDFLLTIFILVITIFFINVFSNLSCKAKSKSFALYEYDIIQGCMVLHKGRWLPLENIRGFD